MISERQLIILVPNDGNGGNWGGQHCSEIETEPHNSVKINLAKNIY